MFHKNFHIVSWNEFEGTAISAHKYRKMQIANNLEHTIS